MIRNNTHRLATIALVAMVSMACSSTYSGELSSGRLDGGMRGLVAEDYEFWEEWSHRQPAAMDVDEMLKPATVFDAWRIEDQQFREQVWDATFHILAALRSELNGVSDGAQDRGLQSLMLRLEPGFADVDWEVAFVSQAAGEAEGIVLRMVSPEGVGLWIETGRMAGASNSPRQWILRAEPAAEEAEGMTIWWALGEDEWRAEFADGAGAERAGAVALDGTWEPLIAAWESALWESVSDRKYLEPLFEHVDDDDRDLAPGWPASLGSPVQMRGLDDFVTDTAFVPRTTSDSLEHFDD